MNRNVWITGILIFGFALAAFSFSQDGERSATGEKDLKALVERLGDSDYAVRKKAEEDVLALGRKAVPALEQAKREHPDAHVRFEAERLLRMISAQAAQEAEKERELAEEPRGGGAPGRDSGTRGFTEWILRRMQERGQLDDDMLERLRKALEQQGSGHPGVFQGGFKGSVNTGDKRIEWEQFGDGRIKVTITRGGETVEHEAESLDALREKAPEVYEEILPYLGRVRVFTGPRADDRWKEFEERSRRFWEDFPSWPGFPRHPATPPAPRPEAERQGPPGGFRLGVWISDVPEVLREHLGLRAGDGVLVDDIVPGSLAERMGLSRMDILRTLNGEKVSSAEEIRQILSTLQSGEKIEASIIRKGQPLKLLTTR